MSLERTNRLLACALAASGLAFAAHAKTDAGRLGKDLTALGAEVAASKDGTIPAHAASDGWRLQPGSTPGSQVSASSRPGNREPGRG